MYSTLRNQLVRMAEYLEDEEKLGKAKGKRPVPALWLMVANFEFALGKWPGELEGYFISAKMKNYFNGLEDPKKSSVWVKSILPTWTKDQTPVKRR